MMITTPTTIPATDIPTDARLSLLAVSGFNAALFLASAAHTHTRSRPHTMMPSILPLPRRSCCTLGFIQGAFRDLVPEPPPLWR